MGVSLNGGTPKTPQNDHFYIVGKPMVVGYHHFRKHPYIAWRKNAWIPHVQPPNPPTPPNPTSPDLQ